MLNGNNGNSFSFGDALFLYVEREGQPLNIAGVSVFEGEIKRADLIKFIASKLPLIPRYLQRVVFPPLDFGLPSWELDPNFDIRNHIHQVKLPHGTEQELKALAGKIVSTRLDRQRPLWDFTLAPLADGRTGMVTRIHHCLVDGIAGIGVMNVIMDSTPNPVPVSHKKAKAKPAAPPRDAGAVFLDRLAKSYFSAVSGALSLESELLTMAQEAVTDPTGPVTEMVRMMSELATPAERLPFNQVCTGPQKFAWTEFPLAEIKAIKNTFGGTVNDVVLDRGDARLRPLRGEARSRSEGAVDPHRDSGERARRRKSHRTGKSDFVRAGSGPAGCTRSTEAVDHRARAGGVP